MELCLDILSFVSAVHHVSSPAGGQKDQKIVLQTFEQSKRRQLDRFEKGGQARIHKQSVFLQQCHQEQAN